MKKFAFTMQRILGFKQTMYEKERNELARMRAQKHAMEQHRLDVLRQLAAREAEFRQKAAEGVGIDEINGLKFYRSNAEYVVRQLDQDIADMEVAIEKQLQIVIQLDMDVQGMEKLREKQWDDYQYEAAQEEKERVLELVSTQYVDEQNEQKRAEKERRENAS